MGANTPTSTFHASNPDISSAIPIDAKPKQTKRIIDKYFMAIDSDKKGKAVNARIIKDKLAKYPDLLKRFNFSS